MQRLWADISDVLSLHPPLNHPHNDGFQSPDLVRGVLELPSLTPYLLMELLLQWSGIIQEIEVRPFFGQPSEPDWSLEHLGS